MKISIIHLSDIHFKTDDDIILDRINKIPNILNDLKLSSDYIFFVVTGDIVFSGDSSQFKIARKCFNEIIDNAEKISDKKVVCIMIPGNHDCCHNIQEKKKREELIEEIISKKSAKIDKGVIDTCCKVQDNYNRFFSNYEKKDKIIYSDRLLKIYRFKIGKHFINFCCFNTSWISKEQEKIGNLMFPIGMYEERLNSLECDLLISVLHHPYPWFCENNRKRLKKIIEKSSDIVITGHEHIQSKGLHDNLEGTITEYIEGGILQEKEKKEDSNFNLINIDLENNKQYLREYKWNGNMYIMEKHAEISFQKGKSLKSKLFEISKSFKNDVLRDIGASFTHPRKKELFLEDVFLYPDLRDLNLNNIKEKNVYDSIINSNFLEKIEGNSRQSIIIGEEKSGKSALCKNLFLKFFSIGYTPIYINGEEIKVKKIDNFNDLVEKHCKKQYENNPIDLYRQIPKEKKCIIIDDINKSKLNNKSQDELIGEICSIYNNVLITTNNRFQLEDINLKKENAVFDRIKRYEINEFGVILRRKLIEKWNKLGQENYIQLDVLENKNSNSEKIIDAIIGRNYVPAYPIYLLIILQTIEVGAQHNLRESTFGYYYEFLITQSFIKAGIKPEDHDSYITYLKEFAYFLFLRNEKEISESVFIEFHKKHIDVFDIRLDFKETLDNLQMSLIIKRKNGVYKFKYLYVYYFFVSKYLADSINSNIEIQKLVSNICEKLYIEENANIVLFLIHHSKNEIILENVRKQANALFNSIKPIYFDKDIKFINSLIEKIPEIFIEDEKGIKKTREEIQKSKDKEEFLAKETDKNKDIEKELNKEFKETNFIAKLNLSMKMLQILGKILQNYYGSLKGGKKLVLVEEAYCLGLRTLKIVLFAILYLVYFKNETLLKEKVKTILEKKHGKKQLDNKTIEKVARKLLFYESTIISFIFIKNTSNFIGSQKLSRTFEKVLEKNKYNSYYLIDMAIKLNFPQNIPVNEISDLKSKFKGNILPELLLKLLVSEHIYMFSTHRGEKQRVCKILNIKMKSEYLISSGKKKM